MVRIEISGGEQAKLLGAKIRAAEKEFKPEMGKALHDGTRPLPAAARRSALEHLPKRKGLNRLVAAAKFTVRRISVMEYQVKGSGIDQLQHTNEGQVSHPTFAHRPRVTQTIPRAKDWFNRPMRAHKRKIADELGDAMHRIAKRIT